MLHSPTMPRWRTVLIAIVRRSWYSSSFSVCDGATTIDSPVWIPIGSRFSMLQTVMQLSRPSRTTSYSISFQPRRHSSTSTWGTPPANARCSASSSARAFSTMPAALATERVAAAEHHREADLLGRRAHLVGRRAGAGSRAVLTPMPSSPVDEELAVLGVADRLIGVPARARRTSRGRPDRAQR
jgi:hypothetical protein